MLITKLPPRLARSAASRPLFDIMGDEPMAMATLAAKFWTTRLVMLWHSGFLVAMRLMICGMVAGTFESGGREREVAKGGGVLMRSWRFFAASLGSEEAMMALTMATPSSFFLGEAVW